MGRLLERVHCLGAKLGPVLLQLPPTLAADHQRLAATLGCFPARVRVTVEFRHPSWFTDETHQILRAHNAALCLADSPRRRTPMWRTADWGYLRLHEGLASPHPCYGRQALRTWGSRLAELWGPGDDIYCFFNNDGQGCAVRDAAWFARAVERAGLRASRVPRARELRVG